MTFGFTNIQVHTANRPSTEVRTALVEAIRHLFLDRSFVQVTDSAEADRTVVIGPSASTAWIPVYDEASGGNESTEELEEVLQTLSAHLNTSAVGLRLSDHVFQMFLYHAGQLIDRFRSEPQYDELPPSEDYAHWHGHVERWQRLLVAGAGSADLRQVWQQAPLDRPEGIEALATVLGMHPDWAMSDWVDVEAHDTFEQGTFPGADEFTTLCFRGVSPPFYKRHSEKAPALVSCGGTTALTFTVGHALFHEGVGTMLTTSFRSTGKASHGVQIVVWGTAIEHGLIDPQIARLRPPHLTYPPSFGLKYVEVPFVQNVNERGVLTCQATAEDFEIPAGIADAEAVGSNRSGLSWHRIYDAFQLTEIYAYVLGKAATPGKGELYIGAVPLDTLDHGSASWRMDIEVST
jgi:hypothetical protein